MSAPDLAAPAALLAAHARRDLDANEARMLAAIRDFMAAHPDCLVRSCLEGHLTGSAWIVDPERRRTLLTHHRKLDKWLQLGGHADGDPDLLAVALREAREEGGITRLRPVSPELFDVDQHWIPARKDVPGHWHFDFRFLIEADPAEPIVVSDESHDLAWVELERIASLNPDESMLRMVRKTPRR